jgi:hypothetical protein
MLFFPVGLAMSLRCPKCGREFDVTLFEYRRRVSCPCGEMLSLADGHTMHAGSGNTSGIDGEAPEVIEELEREIFRAAEGSFDRRRAESFRREADTISAMILYGDMPRIDIEIAIRSFRARVLASFPEKEELFAALYLSRFRRFWKQFRDENDPLLPDESS